MKRTIWAIVVLTLIFVTLPLAAQAAPLQQGSNEAFWRAEYFDNAGLSGRPRFSTFEDTITHNWGKGSPALNISPDHFSARWTSTRFFERGAYLFLLTVDDGARVWLDGKLILDAWDIGKKVRLRAKVYIDKSGEHQIQVAYFEDTGFASITLESIHLGGPQDIVSSWRGEYFTNKYLQGNPSLVRQDPLINFDWSTGSPNPKITRDRFSARWTRYTYLVKGWYRIRVRHDDGMRILVNDDLIYSSWYDQAPINDAFRVHLEEGYHTFVVEYYDHLGDAVAQVDVFGENN